jgi:hypothetical protein
MSKSVEFKAFLESIKARTCHNYNQGAYTERERTRDTKAVGRQSSDRLRSLSSPGPIDKDFAVRVATGVST